VDPLNPEEMLLQSKALVPLSGESRVELQRIVSLNKLDNYTEMDVREEIVSPVLRILGYRKESMFSVEREKWLRILEKGLSADYSMTLWEEDFWVIEAKKPSVTNGCFKYEHLWQAVQYAIHPKINAALVVLCDGHAFEIFDREQSLEAPILRLERQNLVRDFDQLRVVLGPLQAWFFQKRRVIRLLDKVFGKEFQLGRMEEFRGLVDRRLRAKEQQVILNNRALNESTGDNAHIERLRTADVVEIVEGALSVALPWPMIEAATASLITQGEPSPFLILHRIFPETARAANDVFFAHALFYLIRLSEFKSHLLWLPPWLGSTHTDGIATEEAIKRLIGLCLTHFATDPVRKTILLYANGVRRLFKAFMVLFPQLHRSAELAHAMQRYTGDEFDFAQLVSSPKRHLILSFDSVEAIATHQFVSKYKDRNGTFLLESAKLELKHLWDFERRLLSSVENYQAVLRELDLGECHPTEACGVRYDQLGHYSLCMLDRFPKWRTYTLTEHHSEVECIASLGSWKAREWLVKSAADVLLAPDQVFADRFFFGNLELATALRDAYGFR